MPKEITNHRDILRAIESVDIIAEMVEQRAGGYAHELDLEVIVYGRNYNGKKVGPYVRLYEYGSGEVVIRQDDWGGNSFYVSVAGKLDVYVNDPTNQEYEKVGEIPPCTSFGEMSVLAGLPRNATIKVPTGTSSIILEFTRPALRLLRKFPKYGQQIDAIYRQHGLARTLVEVGQFTEDIFTPDLLARLGKAATVNENEGCQSIRKADDGDYFIVGTVRGFENESATYHARRIVLALGNRGMPMKLKVPGENLKLKRDDAERDKVQYKLISPEAYRGQKILVVGAGNSAIEAAVDLVARRVGARIIPRTVEETNKVTLLIRSDFKNDLKLENKMQIYDCLDEGSIKAYFGTTIKEIRDGEVVLMNARTGEVTETIGNDYVFAMTGGDRPIKFLKSIGIKIG